MMVSKTIQLQGASVNVDFEAFNGAVRILAVEVAGIKESASQMGSELKKSVVDGLLHSFPEFFKIGGTHNHESHI